MKTTNNCYVAQKNLYSKPDITYLDSCGPIPLLEIANHNNENGSSEVNKRDDLTSEIKDRSVMYLVNVTVGEDYANCRTCAKESCRVQQRYSFNQEVWLQCITNTNGTQWWSETTVSDLRLKDQDQANTEHRTFVTSRTQISGKARKETVSLHVGNLLSRKSTNKRAVYRMPTCERFETPGGDGPGDDER
jgi:hypothetical protein